MSPFLRRRRGEPVSIGVHERLSADPGAVLVRLAGKWSGPGACPVGDARLIVDTDGPELTFEPLPGSATADGPGWRVAFAVPTAALAVVRRPPTLVIAGSVLPLRPAAEIELDQDGASTERSERSGAPPQQPQTPEQAADPSAVPEEPADPVAAANPTQDPVAVPEDAADPGAVPAVGEPEDLVPAAIETEDPAAALEDAQALVRQLRVRCTLAERELAELRQGEQGSPKLVRAWGEAAELRVLINEREERHRNALAEMTRLRRREAMLRTGLDDVTAGLSEWRTKALSECDRLKAELATARDATARAERRESMARSDVEELRAALEQAHREAARLRSELDQAISARSRIEQEAARASDELQALAEHVAAAEQRSHPREIALESDLAAARAALAQAERRRDELDAELSDRRLEDERRAATLAEKVDQVEAAEARARELEDRTRVLEAHAAEASELREKLERRGERRSLFRGRRTTDGDVVRELADAKKENARLERQVSGLAEQLRELEERRGADAEQAGGDVAELEQQLARQRAVEEDLRALLESERRHAAEARQAADGLRTRLTDLPADIAPEPAPAPAPQREESWSAMDAELLARLERAKAISSSG